MLVLTGIHITAASCLVKNNIDRHEDMELLLSQVVASVKSSDEHVTSQMSKPWPKTPSRVFKLRDLKLSLCRNCEPMVYGEHLKALHQRGCSGFSRSPRWAWPLNSDTSKLEEQDRPKNILWFGGQRQSCISQIWPVGSQKKFGWGTSFKTSTSRSDCIETNIIGFCSQHLRAATNGLITSFENRKSWLAFLGEVPALGPSDVLAHSLWGNFWITFNNSLKHRTMLSASLD